MTVYQEFNEISKWEHLKQYIEETDADEARAAMAACHCVLCKDGLMLIHSDQRSGWRVGWPR